MEPTNELVEDIVVLEDQLTNALRRRAHLEDEMNQDIGLIAQNPSWNRLPLPVDILTSILSMVVFPDSRSIGRLLFVCRDWYSVIMSTPVLWSVIHVVGPSKQSELSSLKAYCRACVGRSGSAPMDITVDYRNICAFDSSCLRDPMAISKGSKHRYEATLFICFLAVEILGRLPRRCSAAYVEKCAGPIQELIGPDGDEMTRWRSFTFHGVEETSSLMSEARPVLKHALSRGLIAWRKRHVLDHAKFMTCNFSERSYSPKEPERSQGTTIPFDLLSIRELDIICKNPRGFRQVLQLSRLVYLTIGVRGPNIQGYLDAQIALNEGEVNLPSLLTLDVQPRLPASFWKHLHAPRLEAMRLQALDLSEGIPSTVHILPSVNRIEFDCLHERLGIARLKVFFPACPNLQTIVCHDQRQHLILSAISELGSRAVMKSSLTRVIGQPFDGNIMRIPLRPTYKLAGNEIIVDPMSLFNV
ncbi:hypothetical protein FRC14_001557 [Serendipita sp. 396]|nr:hypothetical protein FRC14_001557 [Serendipita sp. 396]KAG8852308.1 hypothetical protein FRC20_001548 [Serendipita sp. 405]